MSDVVLVDVDCCRPNGFNPNVMSQEKFEALCDFMRTHTPDEVDPIWVKRVEDGFEIVDGEHRWKAAKAIGWSKLRAFVLDISEDEAKAFNVRKNRERGRIDAIKFGKILFEEHQKGAALQELARKYGYSNHAAISQLISIYENREEILRIVNPLTKPIGIKKALRVLHELKRRQAQNQLQSQPHSLSEVETESSDRSIEPASSNGKFPESIPLRIEETSGEREEAHQRLHEWMLQYAVALKDRPEPTVDVKSLLQHVKGFLEKYEVACPVCGEKIRLCCRRCGHEL